MSPRVARRLGLGFLRSVRGGLIEVREGDCVERCGEQDPASPLTARITVHSERFWSELLHGSLGIGRSYADGLWDCDDAVALTRIAGRNVHRLDRLRRPLRPLAAPRERLRDLAGNTIGRSRRQISAHYDLGNDLFEAFLDDTLSYSCAVFETPQASLHDASLAKLDRIYDALELGPDDHLLEIGTGWGALAVRAALQRGCRVTTTTISREQHDHALGLVRDAGLAGQVQVLLADYRDLRGRYDKLVSVEMIEAVGWRHLRTYLQRCAELLRDNGAMLLQAILIDDRAYHVEKASKTFINTMIFPGGSLPSHDAIERGLRARTDLTLARTDDITEHYVTTLRHWRERFVAAEDRIAAAGYDERFRRLWSLYLAWCEGGFAERRITDVQMLLTKPRWIAHPQVADCGDPSLHALAA